MPPRTSTSSGSTRQVALEAGTLLVLALALGIGFTFLGRHALIADEGVHVQQIQSFVAGDYRLHPAITQLPGYHAVIAALARLTGRSSLFALRLFSCIVSACAVPAFLAVARTVDRQGALIKTVQFAFLPILFPYFFLVYTDLLSLTFVLVGLFFTLRSRPLPAALAALASMLVRQNNILWALFFWMLFLIRDLSIRDVGLLVEREEEHVEIRLGWRRKRRGLGTWLLRTWPFGVLVVLFAGFAWWNSGVAIGDPLSHPFPSFHLGNVYFFLFVFFLLLLPAHLANAPRVLRALRGWGFPLFILLAIGFGAVFLRTFVNDHPDNQTQYLFFLRNQLLVLFSSGTEWKLAMFAPVLLGTLAACVTRLRPAYGYLLYPFTFLFLGSSWLIEQRYYLIPLSLFLLFRVRAHPAWEWALAGAFLVGTAVLFEGIVAGEYFL